MTKQEEDRGAKRIANFLFLLLVLLAFFVAANYSMDRENHHWRAQADAMEATR